MARNFVGGDWIRNNRYKGMTSKSWVLFGDQ